MTPRRRYSLSFRVSVPAGGAEPDPDKAYSVQPSLRGCDGERRCGRQGRSVTGPAFKFLVLSGLS